jgi:aromatic ring-opening dioxygenase LigB subunit
MIVFAAHVPNSPLLLPSISGDRIGAVKKTCSALEQLSGELYAAKPDTIVLISDHPTRYSEAFSISVSDPFIANLAEVGDLSYQKSYHLDFGLIDALQRGLRKLDEPVTLTTDPHLNFASAIPLDYLTKHLPGIKLVPISPCDLDPKSHFSFGQSLSHNIIESSKRIAVISTGDLAHTLTDFAPGGLHASGELYDDTLLTMLEQHNVVGLLQIDEQLRHEAQESAYHKLLILLGVLDGMPISTNLLSYEYPYGVGLAVINFLLE